MNEPAAAVQSLEVVSYENQVLLTGVDNGHAVYGYGSLAAITLRVALEGASGCHVTLHAMGPHETIAALHDRLQPPIAPAPVKA